MPQIVLLGSGHPEYTATRWGTGYLFNLCGEWLMLDCGPAATEKIFRSGISPREVNHLFFSHYHSDHVADYPCFLMTRFDQSMGTEPDLHVYGPPPLQDMTNKIWSPAGAFWIDVVARTRHPKSLAVYHERGGVLPRKEPVVHVHELAPGIAAQGSGWLAYPYTVQHAQPFMDCYCYRFESQEGVIAFSGDASPTSLPLDLIRSADLFVMAAMDFENRQKRIKAAKIVQETGVKRLVITHQSPHLTASQMHVNEILNDFASIFKGPIDWGQDMMEIRW